LLKPGLHQVHAGLFTPVALAALPLTLGGDACHGG